MKELSVDVYKFLGMYGNTVISYTTYVYLGEEEVLRQLLEHGYRCSIEVYRHEKESIDRMSRADRGVASPSVIVTWLDFGHRPGRY